MVITGYYGHCDMQMYRLRAVPKDGHASEESASEEGNRAQFALSSPAELRLD